ncbi:MAG TPA: hypothetical protein VH477_05805 [Bryobacteraceae bacterium]
MEEALCTKGFHEFEDQVAGLEPAARPAMLRLHTWLAYEKQFRNLQLQEQRLSNYAARLKTELEQMQKQRDRKEAEDFARAAVLYTAAQKAGKPYNPEDDGFEFSLADLQEYLRARRAATASQYAS